MKHQTKGGTNKETPSFKVTPVINGLKVVYLHKLILLTDRPIITMSMFVQIEVKKK